MTPLADFPISKHPLGYLARHKRWLLIGIISLLGSSGLAQAIPWIVKRTIETIEHFEHYRGDGYRIGLLTMWMIGLAIAQAILRTVSRIYIFNAGREAEYEIRSTLFEKICSLDREFFISMPVGELMSRFTNDLGAVRGLYGPGVLHAANTLFAYAVALPLMIKIDGWLTLCALAPYPALLLGTRFFAKGIYQRSFALQKSLGEMTTSVQEDLAGIRDLKLYTLHDQRTDRFAGHSYQYLQAAIRLALWRGVILPVVSIGAAVSLLVVLGIGGQKVVDGSLSLGDLVAFNLYVGLLAWPTMALGWMLSLWQRGLSAWHRLRNILTWESQLIDSEKVNVPSISSAISVRNLSVQQRDNSILTDISFELQPGQTLGIVGRVGSGKSTLLEAIARLMAIPPGTLFIGGHDVTDLSLQQVRNLMAYTPQEAFLFSTSVLNNITFGLSEPHQATASHIDEAIRLAGLEDDIAALPNGLETLVGERGVGLSGGQRQRVALARALLSNRPILLLDDSLSAVDSDTEQRILKRISTHLQQRTTVIVSHRVPALRHAHTIIVFDQGKIVQRGTHDQLIETNGVYSHLYRRQLADSLSSYNHQTAS